MTHDPTSPVEATAARALAGVRVAVTRAADKAGSLSEPLAALGAEVVEAPATRIEPLDPTPALAALARLDTYDWCVFTSQHAVHVFWELFRRVRRDPGTMRDLQVAAVGPGTAAALAQVGIRVAITPRRFVAEGLLEAFRGLDDLRGRRVLYLAARGAREVLAPGLRDLGATVDVVPLYQSVPDVQGGGALRDRLLRGEIDVVTFTAGSAVRAFVDAVGRDAAAHSRIVTIGPATSAAVRELGLEVRAEADPSTLDGLVRAVVAAAR